MKRPVSAKERKHLLLVVLSFVLGCNVALAAVRPALENRPVGFAGLTGHYGIPECNNDGTWKSSVTQNGTTYTVVEVDNQNDLKSNIKNNTIVLVKPGSYTSFTIDGISNFSLIGESGVVFSSGCSVKGSSNNILVRNVSVIGYSTDGLDITGAATNIWIDHCTIGWNQTSTDREHPDGAMDITGNSTTNITLSWNKYMNTWKSMLHGSGDSDGLTARHITHYCNYYYNTWERTPRIRGGETHVLNCLYENTGFGRTYNLTQTEYTMAKELTCGYDDEYLSDRLINAIGYGIMAAMKANVNVDSCFFFDALWPIVASRPTAEFEEKYGDLQSPDIKNSSNGGCTAVRQRGNGYYDMGLPDKIWCRTAYGNYTDFQYVPLDYSYESGGETRYLIKPDRLNPGGRSIKFDEYNPEGAWNPASYSGYYPADYVPRENKDVRELVQSYAGADAYTISCEATPPTLTHSGGDLTQTNVSTVDPIVFTWGGGATDVVVTGVPVGLYTKNTGTKTLTISGTLSKTINYSVTTRGGSGEAIAYLGVLSKDETVYNVEDYNGEPVDYSVCASQQKVTADLPSNGTYTLNIYDGGSLVRTAFTGTLSSGKVILIFSTTGLPSGDYTYRLLDGTLSEVTSGNFSID